MPFDPEKYYVTWTVSHHPEGLTKEQLAAMPGSYAAHGLYTHSVLYPADGSYSLYMQGYDGRGPEVKDFEPWEWYRVWEMMCLQFSRRTGWVGAAAMAILRDTANRIQARIRAVSALVKLDEN